MNRRRRAWNIRLAAGGLTNWAILKFLTIGYVVGLILMTEQQARAYVDPGSGLLLLQMLGASVAGALFFLRQRLQKLFRRGAPDASEQQALSGLPGSPGSGVPSASPRKSDAL